MRIISSQCFAPLRQDTDKLDIHHGIHCAVSIHDITRHTFGAVTFPASLMAVVFRRPGADRHDISKKSARGRRKKTASVPRSQPTSPPLTPLFWRFWAGIVSVLKKKSIAR